MSPKRSALTSPTSGRSATWSASVTQALGPVGVLVLNATGPQPEAELPEVGWEDHLAQLAFFVKSPVLLGRAVLPGMRAAAFGRIVHIDSEVADRPPPGRSAYATAKSAQIGLMRSWAKETAAFGITVNSVGPGFIPVERHADVPEESRTLIWQRFRPGGWERRRTSRTPSASSPRREPASSPVSGSWSTAVGPCTSEHRLKPKALAALRLPLVAWPDDV